MQIIPLLATPSQTLTVTLANQTCQINVYQLSTGLFLDLSVANALIIGGAVCEDRNRIVRDRYLGFVGDLAFLDENGVSDPDYTGLGTRFNLAYLEEADVAAIEG